MKRLRLEVALRLVGAGVLFGMQGAENGFGHDGFRGGLAGPKFPLSSALGQKHVDTGDSGDSVFRGEFQELRPLGAVD